MVMFLTIDPKVSSLTSTLSLIFTSNEKKSYLSAAPGAGTIRCGHIEKNDPDTALLFFTVLKTWSGISATLRGCHQLNILKQLFEDLLSIIFFT